MAILEPKQERAKATKARILAAARREFAAHGFTAASTRTIAARAGIHQPQISYHFESKEELWKATVVELHKELAEHLIQFADFSGDPLESLQNLMCSLVDFVVMNPELACIIAQDGTVCSPRLEWLTDTFSRPMFERLSLAFENAAGLEPNIRRRMVLQFTLVGAATMMFARGPAATAITGIEVSDPELVEYQKRVLRGMVAGAVKVFLEDA